MRFDSSSQTVSMESKQYVILKERVLKDGGEWVYLFKKPAVSEDELAKMVWESSIRASTCAQTFRFKSKFSGTTGHFEPHPLKSQNFHQI